MSKNFNPDVILMDLNIANAIENGAEGYVLKDSSPKELIITINSVYNGLSFIHTNAYGTSSLSENSKNVKLKYRDKNDSNR